MGGCIGKGCGKSVFARGMCRSHYARMYRGDPRLDIPIGSIPKRRGRTPCSVEGCDGPTHGQGVCAMHYARLRRTGTLADPVKPTGCLIDGCPKPHNAKGMCSTHYNRRHGRRGHLRYSHNISVGEFERIFEAQGRQCPVCLRDTPPGNSQWHVHHSHECCPGNRSCGRCIVGILCGPCNIGMGGLGDDPDRLERAAALMRRTLPL